MNIRFEGKDIFILGSTPPKLKFDSRLLQADIKALLTKYNLIKLEVSNEPRD